MNSATRGARAASLPIFLATLALTGCQIFDTRPAVTILPAGNLVARDWIDLRVEAGGAPQARFLVDGEPVGAPFPTGADVKLDVRAFPDGIHELVARVEDSTAPRTSTASRLEIRRDGYRVPVTIASTSGPWEPWTARVHAPDPLVRVTATARDGVGTPIPAVVGQASPDRRDWTVSIDATLVALRTIVVDVEVEDGMGFAGSALLDGRMPASVAVSFPQAAPEVVPPVRVVATPAVRVPSATLWAFRDGKSYRLRDVGPSPWNVTLGEMELGPGTWSFSFRRDDVVLEGSWLTRVTAPPGRASCAVEPGGTTVTFRRCGVISFTSPPSAVRLESMAFGEPWPGDLYLIQQDARSWRVCPSSSRWMRGPAPFTATALALDDRNAAVERVSCSFVMGWEWSAEGGEPVAEGAGIVRGRVLAIRGQSGGVARLALLGTTPDAVAGAVRVGSREPTAGNFTFVEAVAPGVAADAVADLDGWSAIAWIPESGPGVAEGLLERWLGSGFVPWPLAADGNRATSNPAIAASSDGPAATAWVEEAPDGTSLLRVRAYPPLWTLLPPVAPEVSGGRVASPSVSPSGPLGYGPHLAFLEISPGGSQRVRVIAWDGSAWTPWPVSFPATSFGSWGQDPARVFLSSERSRAWVHVLSKDQGLRAFGWTDGTPGTWTEDPILLDPQQGTVWADAVAVGLPFDGRSPAAAITSTRGDGQADVRICPSTSGRDCVSLQPAGGAPHRAIALDPHGMSVAWTASDGTVHVRTLTP